MQINKSHQRSAIPHIEQTDSNIPCLADKDPQHKPGLTYSVPVVAAKTLIGRTVAQPNFHTPLQFIDGLEKFVGDRGFRLEQPIQKEI